MRSALPGSRRAPGPSPSRLLPVLLVLVAPEVAPAPSPQMIPQPYNRRIGERYAAGDVSRYEAQYGTPEFRGIDDDHARPWPLRQSIRTIAVLAVVPGRGDDSAGLAYTGRVVEYDNIYTYYMLCGERYCIALAPVEEMLEFFQQHAHPWLHRSVEVIGAIDQIGTPRDGSCPCDAFRAWSIQLFEETAHPSGRPDPTLETLVRGPDAAAGRTITVQGTFRGANLFEDLPPETRRDPGDWVLKDGPFSIWVTGRAPKGKGFSLDPRSRSECDWRLEVTGKVETAARYVYLRAKRVALLRRERRGGREVAAVRAPKAGGGASGRRCTRPANGVSAGPSRRADIGTIARHDGPSVYTPQQWRKHPRPSATTRIGGPARPSSPGDRQ